MRAVTAIAAHRLRSGWRGWAALALLTGLAGGAVLAATAGARRTESAFPRFLRATTRPRFSSGRRAPGGGFDLAVGKLPGVLQIAPVVGLTCPPVTAKGTVDEQSEVVAALDGRLGHRLSGRMLAAARRGPAVRTRWSSTRSGPASWTCRWAARCGCWPSATRRTASGTYRARGRRRGAARLDRAGQPAGADRLHPGQPGSLPRARAGYQAFDGDYVRLAPGTSVSQFTAEATALAREPRYKNSTGGQIFVSDDSVQDAAVERSIQPQAVALAIFALVLAITALLVVGQAAVRLAVGWPRQPGAGGARPDPVAAAAAGLLEVTARGPVRCWPARSRSRPRR